MEKEIKVSCPGCSSVLIIDRMSGKIVETRKPLVEETTGDRLQDAFLKQKQDKETRTAAFDNFSANQKKKKKLAEDIFNASLEDVKEEGDDAKPHSIYDAD